MDTMRELPLTAQQAADYLGITENALRLRRLRGVGPVGYCLSGVWVYWPEDLDAYLEGAATA